MCWKSEEVVCTRKPIDDYYPRLRIFSPLIRKVGLYYIMLGDGQKCYTYQILLKEKCDYIINNKIIVRLGDLKIPAMKAMRKM
jgi:hypothetical protein